MEMKISPTSGIEKTIAMKEVNKKEKEKKTIG